MFNFRDWIKVFQERPGYNDAKHLGVRIERRENANWRVIGVHHLTPAENRGNHNVYIEVLCKQNDRDRQRAVHWTWEGRNQATQPAPPLYADKPPNELKDLALHGGMVVDLWIPGGDAVRGLHATHPDEGTGNTIGHHSFFVCFQEVGDDGEPPAPEPDPDPEPDEPGRRIVRANAERVTLTIRGVTIPASAAGQTVDIVIDKNGEEVMPPT